jgi:hypothetical protein
VRADAVVMKAELRFVVHLDLGHHPARRGVDAREVDPSRLADNAPATVAPDEIERVERWASRELHLDAVVVLREAGDLAAAHDRDIQLGYPLAEDTL